MTTTIHNPNKACCTIAPVVDEDYTPKGAFRPYGGCDKTYITGNTESKKVIIYIFDIFGFSSQALQGADLLAQATNALVIQPNYFPAGAIDYDLYFDKSEKNQAAVQAWWGKHVADFTTHIPITDAVLQAARDDGAKKLGIVGFCFGGKVATITATDPSKVDAIAVVHPAEVAAEDARNLAVPIAFFPSSDEPEEECAKFLNALENKPFASKVVAKRYPNMNHGWAGARANLKDPEILKDYKDVFERLSRFFNDNLVV